MGESDLNEEQIKALQVIRKYFGRAESMSEFDFRRLPDGLEMTSREGDRGFILCGLSKDLSFEANLLSARDKLGHSGRALNFMVINYNDNIGALMWGYQNG
jgi:hypothetical protein